MRIGRTVRNVLVELTPEGLEMARESFLAQTDMEKRLLTMLSPEEKGAASDALEAHPAGSGRARGSLGRVPARPGEGIH